MTTEQPDPPSAQDAVAPNPTAQGPLPLFYRQPEALNADRHGHLALRPAAGHGFAAKTHLVPLVAQEFAAAARSYAIVFTADPAGLPVALLGHRDKENLFLDGAGRWESGCYLPAYVRRYPFLTATIADSQERALLCDMASERLCAVAENENAEPLFEAGRPGKLLDEAAQLCAAFEQQVSLTLAMVTALHDAALLLPKEVEFRAPDGATSKIGGFLLVDEDRLKAMPATRIEAWHRSGWLGAIWAHLISLASLQALFAKL